MNTPLTVHSTFTIERSYPAAPERVFRAFSDPDTKRSWFIDHEGQDVEHYELDFRVGGAERARIRFVKDGHPLLGLDCASEGIWLDIVPNRRIVTVSSMAIAGKRISVSLVTFELLPTETGTDLILTHQGAFFEGADGPEMREGGWRKLLESLASAT
jgi:uncharacterized protein YndB with AHSA1/START domain